VVGAVGDDGEVAAVLAWNAVLIRVAPGILWQLSAAQIGAIPAIDAGWLFYQRVESVLVARITTHIQPVHFQRLFEVTNLDAGRLAARSAQLIHHAWADQASQHCQDRQYY